MKGEVIQLRLFQKVEEPVAAELQEQQAESVDTDGDDEADDVDMSKLENKAHAIRGALSTLDIVDIAPAAFWKVFRAGPNRDLAIEWVRKGVRILREIEEEYDRSEVRK